MTSSSQTGSQNDGITLLAIGDVHLGTRPASVPSDLTEWDVDPRELTPEAGESTRVDELRRRERRGHDR